ncbi:MAG: 50S ribosomal protein L21 [Actinomycetia bacterium]|nr:50S ribosomal protein L21 [Actinomycetes bacterium]
MYAIVRSGGHQYKVAVGDVVAVDKLVDETGASITLKPLLLVDGATVTSDASALSAAVVTAEVLGGVKGPKIRILKFKNKSGYKRRVGHRAQYTQVRITGINA